MGEHHSVEGPSKIEMNNSIAFGLLFLIVVCVELNQAQNNKDSIRQCANNPDRTPCLKRCLKADCPHAMCCNGFCRRGRTLNRACIKKARTPPNFCAGKKPGTACFGGGCCNGKCVHGSEFRSSGC